MGSGPGVTRIKRTDPIGSAVAAQSNSSVRDVSIEFDVPPNAPTNTLIESFTVGTNQTGVLVRNVRFTGPNPPNYAGIDLFSGANASFEDVTIEGFLIAASGTSGPLNMVNVITDGRIRASSASPITIRDSVVGSLQSFGAEIRVANSQIVDGTLSPALTTCVFSYDDVFQPLASDCQ